MRTPFVRRATATTASLALTLTACSGASDGGESSTTTSSSSASATSTSSSSTASEPTVSIEGASQGLAEAVAVRYGDGSVTGEAHIGRWRRSKVAVVTSDDDVSLAVRPKGEPWRVVGGWWPSMDEGADLGGTRHVLVIGSDARPGQSVTRSRADALQLLGVDGSGGAGLMGFARDLWVPIPGHGHGKLNSAMVFGGPQAEVAAVSRLSGIDVDGYVVTGFRGFRRIVDELGPLGFDAPEALDSHLPGGQIPQGKSRLGPNEALAWARERKSLPRGDFDRSRHQGLLLLAAAIQARLKGPDSLPRALTVVDANASSNLTAREMLLFTASFYRVNPLTVGHEVALGPTGMAQGQSIVRLDEESRQELREFRDGRL